MRNEVVISDDMLHKIISKRYIAYKLWSREDIEDLLEEKGVEPTSDNVDLVITEIGSQLSDCTDYDWEIINQAISRAGFGGDE
ncbi:MAG: hypothetical protein IJI66_14045 [Erysipelotrichaceae bacterium]|nr:hypothetical protein [Erysipelotrichaceae bacterium]